MKSAREARGLMTSSVHIYASNQKRPVSRQGVIRVIGQICSPSKSSDAVVPSGSSAQQDSSAKSASLDDNLIALSQNFRAKLLEWIKQIGKHGIESYDEKTEAGRALHTLRMEWGNSLAALRSSTPRTVAGANEKLSAAKVFLTFSCEADGSAIELLALATRELDHVSDGHRTSDPALPSRRSNAQGRFWWLGRLTRRA